MSQRKRHLTHSDEDDNGDKRRRANDGSFVTIGTEQPSDASDIRARDRNNYLPIHLQEPRDEKGRKRFHGAFTGGFSAGYYNTVGSKEGWTPSQFVSSRGSRSTVQPAARPEDFMDEEDLAEMGGQIAATEEFDLLGGTEREIARKQVALKSIADENISIGGLPGRFVEDLIGPAKDPIGVKLLRQMGWREGHGVGPRAKRKRKMKEEEEDVHAAEHLFAPKDISVATILAKKDTYGLGYDPFRNAPEFAGSRATSGSNPVHDKPEKRRTGAAKSGFGVGIFENEDEDLDVYGSGMATYDMIIDDDDPPVLLGRISKARDQNRGSMTALPELRSGLCYDGRPPLAGYILSKNAMPEPKWYRPPVVPSDFVPMHNFDTTDAKPSNVSTSQGLQLSADQRRDILGEIPLKAPQRSVFSFLPIKEQGRLQEFVEKAQRTREALTPEERKSDSTKAQEPAVEKHTALAALKGFMPFGNDLPKQQRYKKFLEVKAGLATEYAPVPQNLTARDAAHELLEFSKAAQIFKPLSSMMASRFTSASSNNDSIRPGAAPDDTASAAELNMYGKLTRTRNTWRPDKLLCKRFNVADPWLAKGKKQDKVEDEKIHEKEVLNERTMRDLLLERDRLVAEGRLAGESEPVKDSGTKGLIMDSASSSINVPDVKANNADTEQGEAAGEDHERPPMDIFKAIFADSDSEEESEAEAEESVDAKTSSSAQLAQHAATEYAIPETSLLKDRSREIKQETTVASLPPPTFRPLFRRKEERRKPVKEDPKPEELSSLNSRERASDEDARRSGRSDEMAVDTQAQQKRESESLANDKNHKKAKSKGKEKKRDKKRKEIVSFEEEEEVVVWKEKVVPQKPVKLETDDSSRFEVPDACNAPRKRARPAAADFM